MLTFAHSWLFWLLPLPLIVRLVVPPIVRSIPSIRVPFLSRLLTARGEVSPVKRRSFTLLPMIVAWILIVTSMARPQWLEPPIERNLPTRDLLLLVDLSASMDHEDFQNAAGEPVNRLAAVKEVMGDFLVRRDGDRVGLVVFGNSPILQVPFTTDLELCRRLLDETRVGMAGPRTALGDAIGLGIQLFDDSDVPTKTIIALTDGNDTASQVPPVEAGRVAQDRGITIHTIAIGDPTTVGEEAIDQEILKDVASTTGGDFFLALDRDQLANIYDRLDQLETREVSTVSHRPRRDLFYLPLALALLVSLAGHLIPVLQKTGVESRAPRTRLRVNARTFELEAVEQ